MTNMTILHEKYSVLFAERKETVPSALIFPHLLALIPVTITPLQLLLCLAFVKCIPIHLRFFQALDVSKVLPQLF